MGVTYNFEGDTVGNEPAGWDDNSSAACSARVSNDVAHSGTKCVKFIDSNNDGWAYLDPEDLFNETEMTLWGYMADTNKVLGIYTYEDGPPSDILALVAFADTGKITARDGGATDDLQDYVKEQWYKIRITHDLGANTYDVWIDDVLKAENYAYVNGAAATFRSLRLIGSKLEDSGLQGYVDDITIGSESEDLACGFEVRHSDSEDLAAGFEVGQGSRDLPAEFEVRIFQDGSAELAAEFAARRDGLQDLAAEFFVQQISSQELPGEFTVRRSSSVELPAEFIIRHSASGDLAAEFIVRQVASQDLAASFDGQVSLNLPGEFVSRQAALQNLAAAFVVRRPGISQDLAAALNVDDTHSITGITRDNAGNRLGNCEIALFRTEPGAPPTYTFIASGMSDALGDYTFTGLTLRRFFVRAQKDGAPNVYDTTDNELEPV